MKVSKKPKTLFLFLACLMAACLLLNASAFAQVSLAKLEGTVTDEEGIGLPGAEVNVRNMDTGYQVSTLTRADGTYIITGIQPGMYEVRVSLSGFAAKTRQGMTFAVAAKV